MKDKIVAFISVGVAAVIIVMVSDLFSTLLDNLELKPYAFGTFAWISFILWNFTSKSETKERKTQLLTKLLLGLPVGFMFAIGMIHIPGFFNNNIIIKYLIIFLFNGIATLCPGSLVPGIFFGIALTFSGLGGGFRPNGLQATLVMFFVMIIFSIIGVMASWATQIPLTYFFFDKKKK